MPPQSLDEVRPIPVAKTPVREVLERYEIVPKKRFGQNFLHETAVCARIVDAAGVSSGDSVLEIGPGLGALTVPLLETGAQVTAVEVDRRIADYLEDTLGSCEGFRLHRGDILKADLAALAPDARTLVANLPYSITGPVLALIANHADRFERCLIMVQREVGIRLTASAGGKEIGAPSVILRQLYRIERLFDVGRGAFLPPPEIVSVVMRFERIAGAHLAPGLRDAVNRAYRQRRKMLRKTLAGTVAPESALMAALTELGYPDSARPETVSPQDWPELLRLATEGGR